MKNQLIIGVVVALALGGALGFVGGMQYQKSQKPDMMALTTGGDPAGQATGRGERGNNSIAMRTGGPNGGGAVGEIISADDKSITVKLPDGSSKIILINSKTSINKSAEGSLEDLKAGESVAAFGEGNSDGSITAVSIQLNPQMRVMARPSGEPEQ